MRNFENTFKHIIWKHFETYGRFLKTLLKHIIWKPLKPMGSFENILKHYLKTLWNTFWKHTIWKPLKPVGEFWKHFEIHYLKTLWNTLFENHWNLWGILKTLWNTIWKQFEIYQRFLKTLWNTFWKCSICTNPGWFSLERFKKEIKYRSEKLSSTVVLNCPLQVFENSKIILSLQIYNLYGNL